MSSSLSLSDRVNNTRLETLEIIKLKNNIDLLTNSNDSSNINYINYNNNNISNTLTNGLNNYKRPVTSLNLSSLQSDTNKIFNSTSNRNKIPLTERSISRNDTPRSLLTPRTTSTPRISTTPRSSRYDKHIAPIPNLNTSMVITKPGTNIVKSAITNQTIQPINKNIKEIKIEIPTIPINDKLDIPEEMITCINKFKILDNNKKNELINKHISILNNDGKLDTNYIDKEVNNFINKPIAKPVKENKTELIDEPKISKQIVENKDSSQKSVYSARQKETEKAILLSKGLSSVGRTKSKVSSDLVAKYQDSYTWQPSKPGHVLPRLGTNRAKSTLREVCVEQGYFEKSIDRNAIQAKQGLFETLTNVKPALVNWKTQTSAWLKNHDKAQLIKAELSKSKLAELRQLFDLLDADGSGEIAADEVAAALIACGIKVTDEMLAQMFGQIGKELTDELTFTDFAEMMISDENSTIGGGSEESDDGEPNVSMTFALMIIAFRRKKMLEENDDIFDSTKKLDVETMLHIASDFKDFKKKDNTVNNKMSEKDAYEIALDRINAIRSRMK